MKSIFFVVSEGSSIDISTNALSIFNIIEGISSASLPLIIPKCIITLVVEREEGDPEPIEGRITITNNEHEIHSTPAQIHARGAPGARLSITINGLPVHAPGKLTFKYTVDDSNFEAQTSISVSEPKVSGEQHSEPAGSISTPQPSC